MKSSKLRLFGYKIRIRGGLSMAKSETGARSIVTELPKLNPTSVANEGRYSLYINLGWTFSDDFRNRPSGKYTLRINGKTIRDRNNNQFSNGRIALKENIKDLKGEGELIIKLTNGPAYYAKVKLGELPDIATPDGLARRLTNLGFYAGSDTKGKCSERMAWAIRAFKRMKLNNFIHNSKEEENNRVTVNFLKAVQRAYGAHPDDTLTQELQLTAATDSIPYCGMFGDYRYNRGSFEDWKQADDIDQGPGQTGIREGQSAKTEAGKPEPDPEPIAGEYTLYLRVYDPNETIEDPKTKRKIKVQPFSNRINLPQPIHMAQFVLFELGYWAVCGEEDGSVDEDNALNRQKFIPDGWYGRNTQWAVREFQFHAKFEFAAKEDVTSAEKEFLHLVYKATGDNPSQLTGDARYPEDGKVDGELNEETRKALQAWADGALRCPAFAATSELLMQIEAEG
jgi:hypothetical protein